MNKQALKKEMMNTKKPTNSVKPNRLAAETSLYLRQHANNPVDWYPWGEEALRKARNENKPLLISIGYSACHWCHVMEHESFSDAGVADFMNLHFVNIKIDREERPDLDQLYMESVQLLQSQGGWPLNCFALPDGRPFWGATYFQKSQWLKVMEQITTLFQTEPGMLEDQAGRIRAGVSQMNLSIASAEEDTQIREFDPESLFRKLTVQFDRELGGFSGAPKFPMPSVYRMLLHDHHILKNNQALEHVLLTLNQMASGGIYDQIGGGFARYSTDEMWKVPHFEKMLYDNAQLITLYCEAFIVSKRKRFKVIALETLQFLEREMGSPDNGFSASIDADSPEGEGLFYTFTIEEIKQLLGRDAPLFIKYWKIDGEGAWENGKNILLAPVDPELFIRENRLDGDKFKKKLARARSILLQYRNQRPKPATDPKIITSWNAMMVQAYVHVFRITGEVKFLTSAEKLAGFLLDHAGDSDGGLNHIAVHSKPIPGFLDDYSTLILALISLHSFSLEEKWLLKAKELAETVIKRFYDEPDGLFYFTGSKHEKAFAQRQEIHDNVIPSANSMMMEGLYLLGQIFEENNYLSITKRAVNGMAENIIKHPASFSNWGSLLLRLRNPFYSIAISGEKAGSHLKQIAPHFLPQALITGSKTRSSIPLLMNLYQESATQIHICSGNECYPPFGSVDEAIRFFNRHNS
jgi:uncharacterized protein